MPHEVETLDKVTLKDVRLENFNLSWFRRPAIRVLVVVDGGIGYSDDPNEFGVGRFVRLLRETTVGCTRFLVDVASRDSLPFADKGAGGAGHLRYPGFRYDSRTANGELVLDRYHEVFLLGFSSTGAAQGAEQAAITAWMDAGGGVFATGDHEDLGAGLASGVPRVRSMRRWTNADGVPPVSGLTRIDTNQPATPGQRAGVDPIPFDAQGDATAQRITWIPEWTWYHGLSVFRRPHPILCHPRLGPIDVMPDHMHEGVCLTRAEIESNPARRADFPGSELPRIIANGQVVPHPPFNHVSGPVNSRTIPMISVYDGWAAGVGRIVVDSTWHHWMNLNLVGLETAGGDEWKKIARYFVNIATWIAPRGLYWSLCWWELLSTHFAYPGIEHYGPAASDFALGGALRHSLTFWHGPCAVRSSVIQVLCDIAPELCHGLRRRLEIPVPDPGPWRTFPQLDEIELVVLGGMVRGTLPLAGKVREALSLGDPVELTAAEIQATALDGAAKAVADYSATVVRAAKATLETFSGRVGSAAEPTAGE